MNNFSIFKDGSSLPKAAEENKLTIEILSQVNLNGRENYGTIVAYLSKEFSMGSRGSYAEIFQVPEMEDKLMRLISDETQLNFANYGYLTKKSYIKGESPKISLEFRVMANDPSYGKYNTGNKSSIRGSLSNPVVVANALLAMTQPHVSSNALFNRDRLIGKNTKDNGTLKNSDYESAAQGDYSSIMGVVDNLFSKKPPVCKLTIGNIFRKDMMVVESVEVTLSKQFYSEGVPLYGDFNVQFTSLFDSAHITDETNPGVEDIFGIGLNPTGSEGRVTFSNNISEEDITRMKDSLVKAITGIGEQPK